METNQVETKPTVCPKCGKSVQSDFTRCPYCGAKLGASSNNLKDFKEKAKSVFQSIVRVAKAHKKATIGVVVALVVIIALIPIISAISSPFNSLKANNVSVGYQTAEEVEKQFGKPTDVLTDTYSSLPASCDEVWVYYPDSIDNQIKSINKMLENANSFADLDKADKEYQKLTEKKFKQVVIGISDDKVVFYSLNTQAMYNEEDLFATKDSKELSKCTFNKTMVCRDTTVSDNKITFTAKFTDGSIFIGKVSGYSRVDEKNPTVEFSCPWSKLSLTLNVVDHYFSNSCTCKNCGNEVHDLDNDCKCSRCNNSFHNIHGCECVNCDYNTHTPDADCVCVICNQLAHRLNEHCQCNNCRQYFHSFDDDFACENCDNAFTIQSNGSTCTITDFQGYGDIVIPSTYKGMKVTSIGEDAFYNCDYITSITIPNSVTSIGWRAFGYCSSLTSIIMENSVTTIDNMAFELCTGLRSITIPDSVTTIGYDAFYGCSSLTRVDITDISKWSAINFNVDNGGGTSSNPLEYADELYLNGELITDLVLSDNVEDIANYSFAGYRGLKSVYIGESVNSIGHGVFANCINLNSIIVAAENTKYHSKDNCIIETESKTLILGCPTSVIPNDGSVTIIGDYAFINCKYLTNLTIPDNITCIGKYAFRNCSNLSNLTIGSGVTKIDSYAFNKCTNLGNLTFPDNVRTIGEYAFSGCGSQYIYFNEGLTHIGFSAFSGCSNLMRVTIPNSETDIGYYAFSYCSKLYTIVGQSASHTLLEGNYHLVEFINIGEESKVTVDANGFVIFNDGGDITVIDYIGNEENITVPIEVTKIRSDSLSRSNISSVTIHNGVTYIECYAFDDQSIIYNGTYEEWKNIDKDEHWGSNREYTIHCTDGDYLLFLY